jgi:hypothetical protein
VEQTANGKNEHSNGWRDGTVFPDAELKYCIMAVLQEHSDATMRINC